MTMTPLLALQIHAPPSPRSFWRWGDVSETPARTRSCLAASGKIHSPFSRSATSPQAEALNPGASARNRYHPAPDAVFKSP